MAVPRQARRTADAESSCAAGRTGGRSCCPAGRFQRSAARQTAKTARQASGPAQSLAAGRTPGAKDPWLLYTPPKGGSRRVYAYALRKPALAGVTGRAGSCLPPARGEPRRRPAADRRRAPGRPVGASPSACAASGQPKRRLPSADLGTGAAAAQRGRRLPSQVPNPVNPVNPVFFLFLFLFSFLCTKRGPAPAGGRPSDLSDTRAPGYRPGMPMISAGFLTSIFSARIMASSSVNGSMFGWIRLRSMRLASALASSNLYIRNLGSTNSR